MRKRQPSRLSPPASWHPSLNRLLPQVYSPHNCLQNDHVVMLCYV